MRLLEYTDGRFVLTKELFRDLPRYAILSHTWGPDTDEVTYRDLVEDTGKDKIGYKKIEFCGKQAKSDGLQYFWVDTCCIDKSNNYELTRAINSMFRWYQNAARCYVYLSDMSIAGSSCKQQPGFAWEPAFRAHRWFMRGWTLQELLAPASVEFFAPDGQRLGDKRSLEQQIHEITGIAVPALRGRDLSQFGVDERFKWAATRDTALEEDWAYCLLGIFGIFMPHIYGEGKEHAVCRLKRKIDKAINRNNSPNYQGVMSSDLSKLPVARGAAFDSQANERGTQRKLSRPITHRVECLKCGNYGHNANDVHCYKCGEYGHYANDDHCYKCEEYGHYANDDHCYKCGKYGHYADDVHCYKCDEYGHYARDCSL